MRKIIAIFYIIPTLSLLSAFSVSSGAVAFGSPIPKLKKKKLCAMRILF